jgi:ERCC4-type nuclease
MIEIVVDVREHALIEKLNGLVAASESSSDPKIKGPKIKDQKIKIETAALLLGDVLFRTDVTTELILFERKSFADLLASIKDGRYDEQSHRIIHTSGLHTHNIVYIIEGIFSTLRTPADKKIILSAMTSLSYFKGFSVVRTATVTETAELIWAMANKIQKEFEKGKPIPSYALVQTQDNTTTSNDNQESNESENVERTEPVPYGNFVKKSKRENITPENIGEILLAQIPGISNHIATEILKHFGGSFTRLIDEIRTNPEKLDAIYLESSATVTNGVTNVSTSTAKRRKLSSAVIKSIRSYLIERQINNNITNDTESTDMVEVDHK